MSNHEPIRVLSADPPWSFGDKLPGDGRGAEKHYPCLEPWEIMRFPFPSPLADNAILFLWRVASMQQEALDVIKAWGFTLKSEIVWKKLTKNGKPHFGMGRYTRASHETALIAVRGRFQVDDRGIRSLFETEHDFEAVVGEHSEKPDAFYDLVEQLCGEGPYAELFGRKPRPGWHVYGNQVPNGYIWTPRSTPWVLKSDAAEPAPLEPVDLEFPPKEPEEDIFLGSQPAKPKPKPSAASRTVPLPLQEPVGGPLPPHVIPELGQHPALTSEPDRALILQHAVLDRLLEAAQVSQDPISAWMLLQYKAPKGWIKETEAKLLVKVAENPQEMSIGDIANGLFVNGFDVSLLEIAQWQPDDRRSAVNYLKGNSNRFSRMDLCKRIQP